MRDVFFRKLIKKKCLVCCWVFKSVVASGGESLSLPDYLSQVVQGSPVFQATEERRKAALWRAEEGSLLLAPVGFSKFSSSWEGVRNPAFPYPYNQAVNQVVSVGVLQRFSFGLQARAHYDITRQTYSDLVLPASPFLSGISFPYYDASPVLEFTLPLWRDQLGRTLRAQIRQKETEMSALQLAAQFQQQVILTKAESAYWSLVTVRESLKVQAEACQRARELHQWNVRRVHMNLADSAEAVQSEALVKAYDWERAQLENQERLSVQTFNLLRGRAEENVDESLDDQTSLGLKRSFPKRQEKTARVASEWQRYRSLEAVSEIQSQQRLPQLELFASLAFHGQGSSSAYSRFSEALGSSFNRHPSYSIGLRFEAPLAFEKQALVDRGVWQDRLAAEKDYEQALLADQSEWKNLETRWHSGQKEMLLLSQLEVLKANQLQLERKRLKEGRTTTQQVLLFEQDYLKTQLGRLRTEGDLLLIQAQTRPYLGSVEVTKFLEHEPSDLQKGSDS